VTDGTIQGKIIELGRQYAAAKVEEEKWWREVRIGVADSRIPYENVKGHAERLWNQFVLAVQLTPAVA